MDLVLFEGWNLGFRPLSDAAAAAVDPDLVPVNEKLRQYESAWDAYADVWLVVNVPDPNCVYKCDSLHVTVLCRDHTIFPRI